MAGFSSGTGGGKARDWLVTEGDFCGDARFSTGSRDLRAGLSFSLWASDPSLLLVVAENLGIEVWPPCVGGFKWLGFKVLDID